MSYNTPFHSVVNNFMGKFGSSTTLIVDNGTGTYVDSEYIPTIITLTAKVMVFDYIKKTDGVSTEQNTLIQTGDKMLYVKLDTPYDLKPAFTKVLLGSVPYKIVALKDLNPTMGDSIVYEIYARA